MCFSNKFCFLELSTLNFFLQNVLKNSLDTNKIMEEEFEFSK